MRSPQESSEPIGERIKTLRMQRGWSVRHAAELAGISHSQWSRIERGERSADNRFILAAIAQALKVALAALTGHIGLGGDQDKAETNTSIYLLMQAVIESDLDDPPTVAAGPLEPLLRQLDLAMSLRLKCDYTGAARLVPDVLRGLHAASFGADREGALRAMVLAEDTASFVVRYLGDPASAVLVADRGRQAADLLDDPVTGGMAAWSQAHAASGCGLYARAQRIAGRAAGELAGHLGLHRACVVEYRQGQRGIADALIG